MLLKSSKFQTTFIKTIFKDSKKKLKELKITVLNGAGLHVPAHAKLKTRMGYITHLEHYIVRFPICSWLINFYTIGNNDNNTYMSQMNQ